MFSDSRWWYTYVVCVPKWWCSDAGSGSTYVPPMLHAALPNRAACYVKQLSERQGFPSVFQNTREPGGGALRASLSLCSSSFLISAWLLWGFVDKALGETDRSAYLDGRRRWRCSSRDASEALWVFKLYVVGGVRDCAAHSQLSRVSL